MEEENVSIVEQDEVIDDDEEPSAASIVSDVPEDGRSMMGDSQGGPFGGRTQKAMLQLGATFCPLWFLANWGFNASLVRSIPF